MTSFVQQKPKQKPLKRLSNITSQNSTQNKSWQLAKIIEFLRLYYLKNPHSDHLTLDEIVKQCENLSLDCSTEQWLITEALPNNPRVDMQLIDNSTKFHYKPPLQIEHDQGQVRSVLDILKTLYETYDKTTAVEDIQDSTTKANMIVKRLKEKGKIVGYTGKNKKEFLVYNDSKLNLPIHSDFIQQWRSVSIEGLTKENIRQYLRNSGHTVHGEEEDLHQVTLHTTTSGRRPRRPIIQQNVHIADQLQTYTNT
ncbi:unnamed protein product [Adineta steineri]|uniref:Transcription initiation factor IIE subunit beta n=1 Tax=Adineta steineri TaxID=433720 RepID=A0A819GWD9_9BILA|nr:unnamed protein product [Adineta steineri]CAF3886164.1 unnamed protein product [Adineta steineri]CAF3985246.1 unnamed protein product [Adineta steineri]